MTKLTILLLTVALVLGAQITSIPAASGGGGGAPTGAAGGSLAGTYPDPTLAYVATNSQTGASYAILTGDRDKLVTLANANPVAVSIAAATGAGFPNGWAVTVLNSGVGTATITPTTSTIEGVATLVLLTGQSAKIWSNGTNYRAVKFRPLIAGSGIGVADAVAGQTLTADTVVMLSNASAQSMTPHSCIDAGANDTYTCDILPALAAYPTTTNLLYVVLTPNTANTGAATLNVQGKGAKPIYKNTDGTDLADNDLRAGIPILLKWDAGSNSGNGAFFVEGQLGNAGSGATANTKIGSFGATFDGGGAPLVVGTKAYTRVPFACTATSWSVVVDTGTATIDVWRVNAASTALPTIAGEIAGTGHPAIAANNAVKANIANWTAGGTTIAADDLIGFNIDAATGVTWMQVVVECDKS